jgi:Flp pilus assembly pilin Flp
VTLRACLLHDQRGAVFVEYASVLVLVSLGASLAVIALGSLLLDLFRAQQAILLSPVP